MGFVSAQPSGNTCSSPDDVILRLSSQTNAHGEAFSTTGTYPVDICYSQIFGTSYVGTNPHSCSLNNANKVLKLSALSNAHSEIPDASVPTYTTYVCYGDLVCHSVAGNVNCPNGEQEVVSLSGQTNAHIEKGNSNIYTATSNYKICCSNSGSSPVGQGSIANVGWAYYNAQPISAGTFFCPNSAIYAYAITSGVSDGTTLTFKFYEEDALVNDFIFENNAFIQNNFASFPVNFADTNVRNLLHTYLDGTNNDAELLFKAEIGANRKDSSVIIYGEDTALCTYNPPTITVTSPIHQGIYFANTNINFVATCTSQTGPLTYSWNIVQNDQTITNTNPNFQQTFTQGGQATITLTCTDLQGLSATAQNNILVINNPSAFAYINDPAWKGVEYEFPVSGTPYFRKQVSFSASDSFAVDNSGACSVNCIGGNCPLQTQNSPASCGGGPLTINGAPSSQSNAVWTSINFDWRFWDSNWNEPWTSNDGLGSVSGLLEYDDVSNTLGDKHMSVTMQAINGDSSISASFQREFTLGRCLNNGANVLLGGTLEATSNLNICRGGDQLPNTGDECCPSGLVCADQNGNPLATSGQFSCQISSITRCENFDNQNSCNSNTLSAYPQNSYGSQQIPACTFLQCYWISDAAGCGVRATQYPSNSQNGCNPTGNPISNCAWTTTQSECLNGIRTISYVGASANTPDCNRPQINTPCGSLNFELGFFGIVQFISTVLIISLFYIIFGTIKNVKK